MEKEFIQEGTSKDLIESWYKEAREQTLETLPSFLSKLCEKYSHDMNTICEAMCAGALGAISAIDKTPEGGIAPIQQAKILSLFVRRWARVEGPAKIISWWGILRPENRPHFTLVPKQVVESISVQAKSLLEMIKKEEDSGMQHEGGLKDHLDGLAQGKLPWGLMSEMSE